VFTSYSILATEHNYFNESALRPRCDYQTHLWLKRIIFDINPAELFVLPDF